MQKAHRRHAFFPASQNARGGIAAPQTFSYPLNRRISAMAAVNTNSVATFVSGKGLIATTFEAFQRWNDVRRTRAVLSKLSDRELSDIGLCRGDIEDVAHKSAF